MFDDEQDEEEYNEYSDDTDNFEENNENDIFASGYNEIQELIIKFFPKIVAFIFLFIVLFILSIFGA